MIEEPKPYSPPDFNTERELTARDENRLRKMAQVSTAQLQAMRNKYETRIEIMKKAHQEELAKLRKESFQEGYSKGLEETHESVEKALQNMETAAVKLLQSERNFLCNAEKHVVSLALAVAKKLIGKEIESDKNIVLNTVREAIKKVADKARITILLNPADLENVKSHRQELQALDKDFSEIEFISDDKIDPGDCIVETRNGSIDGRFASQVAEIERSFSLN